MLLPVALIEFSYAKDHSPASRRWYHSRLGAFIAWTQKQGVNDLEAITAPLVRRYLDTRRTAISRTGKPLDSHILHGYARAIRVDADQAVAQALAPEQTVNFRLDHIAPRVSDCWTVVAFITSPFPGLDDEQGDTAQS